MKKALLISAATVAAWWLFSRSKSESYLIDGDSYSNYTGGVFDDVGGFIKVAAGMANDAIFESDDMALPNLNMQVSTAYFEKVKKAENGIKKGWDATKQKWFVHLDSVGIPTIAYGHVVLPSDKFNEGISESEAIGLLLMDIQTRLDYIRKNIKIKLTQGQFDAYLDFIYNAGEGYFLGTAPRAKKRGINVVKAANEGGFDAGFAMMKKHYDIVISLPAYADSKNGLINRHRAQYEMAYLNKY